MISRLHYPSSCLKGNCFPTILIFNKSFQHFFKKQKQKHLLVPASHMYRCSVVTLSFLWLFIDQIINHINIDLNNWINWSLKSSVATARKFNIMVTERNFQFSNPILHVFFYACIISFTILNISNIQQDKCGIFGNTGVSTSIKYVWLQCDFELTDQLVGSVGLEHMSVSDAGLKMAESWYDEEMPNICSCFWFALLIFLFVLIPCTYEILHCFSFYSPPPPARWGYWCDLSGVALWSTHHFAGRGDSVVEQICTLRCNLKLWEGGFSGRTDSRDWFSVSSGLSEAAPSRHSLKGSEIGRLRSAVCPALFAH